LRKEEDVSPGPSSTGLLSNESEGHCSPIEANPSTYAHDTATFLNNV